MINFDNDNNIMKIRIKKNNVMRIKIKKDKYNEQELYDILEKICNKYMHNLDNKPKYADCLLEDYIEYNSDLIEKVHRIKCIQMNIGKIWRDVICKLCDYQYTINNHIQSDKYVIQLKNSFNTDNNSSRQNNYDKLIQSIEDNPKLTAIYGVINCKTDTGKDYIIEHKDRKIRYLSGMKLLEFLFNSKYQKVLDNLKNIIELLICEEP